MNLKPDLIAEDKSQEIDIRKILTDLTFIENKERWGLYLRTTIREIPKEDFEMIRSELMKQRKGIEIKKEEKLKKFPEEHYIKKIMELAELESSSLHDRLCEMLEWIGTWSGYNVSRRHK